MADTVVEVPPKAVAQVSTSPSMPEAAHGSIIEFPDGYKANSATFAGVGADHFLGKSAVTHTETDHLQDVQADISGGNLQYSEQQHETPHSAKEQADMDVVMKILSDAQTKKSGSPAVAHDIPLSEETSAQFEPPQVVPHKKIEGKKLWKWDAETVRRFVAQLNLRMTIKNIVQFPGKIIGGLFRWITSDSGGKPTPLPQSPQGA